MSDWHPCLKQKTKCIVVLLRGTENIIGVNRCLTPEGCSTCPRVTAGCKTGEGYELCGPPVHAEVDAANQIPEGNEGGIAYLYGHDYFCGDCQKALTAKGVRSFVITGEDA